MDFGQPGLVPLCGAKVSGAWLGRRGCSGLRRRGGEVGGADGGRSSARTPDWEPGKNGAEIPT
jgi:hypothetical protein